MKKIFSIILIILSINSIYSYLEDTGSVNEIKLKELEPDFRVCPAVYAPVCGVDGRTYGNSCEAEVDIAYQGECEGNGLDPENPIRIPISEIPVEENPINFSSCETITDENTCRQNNCNIIYTIEPSRFLLNPLRIFNSIFGEVQYEKTFSSCSQMRYPLNSQAHFTVGLGDAPIAGETCINWIERNDMVFESVLVEKQTALNSSTGAQQEILENQCLYQEISSSNINCMVATNSPGSNFIPVSECTIIENNDLIERNLFKVNIDEVHYNSLNWENIDQGITGDWGESCSNWLESLGYDNVIPRAYVPTTLRQPHTCAYELKVNGDENDITCVDYYEDLTFTSEGNQNLRPVESCFTNSRVTATQIYQQRSPINNPILEFNAEILSINQGFSLNVQFQEVVEGSNFVLILIDSNGRGQEEPFRTGQYSNTGVEITTLGSPNFERLIVEVGETYDVIIYDSIQGRNIFSEQVTIN